MYKTNFKKIASYGIAIALGYSITACNITNEEEINEESLHTLASSSSKFIFFDDFENGKPFSKAHNQELGSAHSLTSVAKPNSSGNAARFELRDNDPIVKGSRRSEVTIVKGSEGHIGKDTWYAFDLLVPNDYKDEDDGESFNQFYQDGGPSGLLFIRNGKFTWRFFIDGQKKDYDLGKIEKGTWNNFVIHMVHSYGTDGLTELWLNDQMLMNVKGRNMNNKPLPKWKMGIYKSKWGSQKTTVSKRVLYFDNVKVGDKSSSLADMKNNALAKSSTDANSTEGDGESESGNSNLSVSNLTFINALTEKDIKTISDGEVFNLQQIGSHKMNIRANFPSGSKIGSVKFDLSGQQSYSSIEKRAPFALFGHDGNGNYYYGSGLKVGKYKLTVTPYSGPKGTGEAGKPYTISFTIIDQK